MNHHDKKTIDFTNITCYNEFVVGFMEICNQLGIPYKDGENSLLASEIIKKTF